MTQSTDSDVTAVGSAPQGAPLRVHHLRPAPGAKTAKIRVGRGEAGRRGKTSGRGTKGTGARKNVPVNFEGGQMPLQIRLPKLKGFTSPFRTEYQVVNLDQLSVAFPEGGTITIAQLVEAGLVRKNSLVKILGNGEASVSLNVTANAFSGSALTKLAASGGSATVA
jgi:large subunit ribosomal protein L15